MVYYLQRKWLQIIFEIFEWIENMLSMPKYLCANYNYSRNALQLLLLLLCGASFTSCCCCCFFTLWSVRIGNSKKRGEESEQRKTSSTCIEAMELKTHDHKPWKHNFRADSVQFRNKNKQQTEIQEFQTHTYTHKVYTLSRFYLCSNSSLFHFWWCVVYSFVILLRLSHKRINV